MKKALVTGATGFLGINLLNQLVASEWDVTILHLPGENLKYLELFNIKYSQGNILDYKSIVDAIPEGDDVVIFHLAGDTTMWPKLAKRQDQINIDGTVNVCRAAIEKNVSRLIYTSSSSAFGYHNTRLTESTVSNALTCGMNYNRSKYLGEQEVKKAVMKGLDAVILNPCNMIGPYDAKGWASMIINVSTDNVPGVGPGTGTFSHVKDIAAAHITAVELGKTGQNYLLGGVEASFEEVFSEINQVLKKKLPLKTISAHKMKIFMQLMRLKSFFDRKEPLVTYPKYKRLTGCLTCDDSKARTDLGFSTTTLTEMISDSCRWLKEAKLI